MTRRRERAAAQEQPGAPRPAIPLASIWVLVACMAGAAGAWTIGDVMARRVQAARLPAPPASSVLSPPVADLVASADAAARRDPTSGDTVGDLGIVYQASLRDAEAHTAYAVAAELSSDPRWTYYRALLFEEHGSQPEALAAFTRVVTAEPSNGLAWFHIAEIAFKDGRLDAAQDAYRRVLEAPALRPFTFDGVTRQSVPLAAYAEVGLARVAAERGDAAQARTRLQAVVAAQPRFGQARTLLRQLETAPDAGTRDPLGRSARAYVPPADPLLDAVVARSRQTDLLLKHVALAARGGDQAWREFLVRRAFEFNPAALDVLLEMASTLQSAGKHDQALEYLRRAEQVAPGDHHVLVEQGKTLSDLGRLEEAESVLRRAVRVRDAAAEYNLGTVLDRLGREDQARERYERTLTIDPFHVRAMNNLATMLARSGQTQAAMALYARALQVDPDDPEVLSNVGSTLIAQGRFAEALRALEASVAIDPRAADAHNNLGIALAQSGRLADARKQFEEALRLDARHGNARQNLEALNRLGK